MTLHFEGRAVQACEGDSVAVALLRHGITLFRDCVVSSAPRGPLCLMGVCFDCLVEVDGRANVQACMTVVREGMAVRRQHGARAPQDVAP